MAKGESSRTMATRPKARYVFMDEPPCVGRRRQRRYIHGYSQEGCHRVGRGGKGVASSEEDAGIKGPKRLQRLQGQGEPNRFSSLQSLQSFMSLSLPHSHSIVAGGLLVTS